MTTAFLTHARLAAKNLKLDKLPLVVTPHPLNDLDPEQVKALARAAYPLIIGHLTTTGPLSERSDVDFVHPGNRSQPARSEEQRQ